METNNNFEKTVEQAAAFQKLWAETATKIMQAAFTVTPNSPPPEVMRHIRGGIFQALAASWDEFMRSPQFLEGMRQWLENAISFRKISNDFLAKARNELQAPSRDDMDTIMLTVRHMEKRLLDRLDEIAQRMNSVEAKIGGPRAARGPRPPRRRKNPAKTAAAKAER